MQGLVECGEQGWMRTPLGVRGEKGLRFSPREKREVKDGDVVDCVGDEVCGHRGYNSKTVCHFFLILHPFNALLDVGNQFFQEL